MIYTKKNLREFVECVNGILNDGVATLPYGNRVVIIERDPEIYRNYQWGVGFRDDRTGGVRMLAYKAEFGSPRNAALNLFRELADTPDWYHDGFKWAVFWSYPEFREHARKIEG